MLLRFPICLLLCLSACLGCAEPGPTLVEVRGKVTYQGKPVTVGTIVCTPQPGSGGLNRPATGKIESDGSFELRALPQH